MQDKLNDEKNRKKNNKKNIKYITRLGKTLHSLAVSLLQIYWYLIVLKYTIHKLLKLLLFLLASPWSGIADGNALIGLELQMFSLASSLDDQFSLGTKK